MSDESKPDEGGEEIGSVAEEAAKLFDALQDWAGQTGQQKAAAAGTAAQGFAAGLRGLNEHIATGGDECRYCPVCRAIALVRETSPEVRQHLAAATTSLLQAALTGLAAASQPPERSTQPVQHIDLDDEPDAPSWDAD